MQFFIPMKIPTVTHQEKQVHVVNGKPIFYEPADLKQARADLTDYLAQYAPKKPLKQYQGLFFIIVTLIMYMGLQALLRMVN